MMEITKELIATLPEDECEKILSNIAKYREYNPDSAVSDETLILMNTMWVANAESAQQRAYEAAMALIDDLLDIDDGLGPDWPSDEAQNMWVLVNHAGDYERQQYEKKIGKRTYVPWPPRGLGGWVRIWWMRAHDLIDLPIHRWEKKGEPPRCLGPVKISVVQNMTNSPPNLADRLSSNQRQINCKSTPLTFDAGN